jgi:N-acetylmuramoyl-L-alanine amidase
VVGISGMWRRAAGLAVAIAIVAVAGVSIVEWRGSRNHWDGVASAAGAPDTVTLLGRLIYGEARGEPYVGQVAVGAVVVNRTQSTLFPRTVAGVIFQPGAFDAVSDGQIWRGLENQNMQAARAAVAGWDPSGGSLYYWNPATATSRWIWSRKILTRIGKHVFGI